MNLFYWRTARRALISFSLASVTAFAIAFCRPAAAALPASPTDIPPDAAGAAPKSTTTTDTLVGPFPDERPENGYWSVGDPRWFVSLKCDAGTPYLKPHVSAGYGLPHFIWGGVDLNSITTGEFTQVYAGVRAATPVLDLAFGFRDTLSFGKAFLAPKASYSRSDVLDAIGPTARYWAWEAEAVGIVPLPHAAVVADFVLVRTLDVPDGQYVYDESYRTVVGKPLFAVLRTAVVARMLREGALKVGPLVEYVFENGRERDVIRVGPASSFQLTDHLEAHAVLTFAVSSPDSLGLTLGAYGVLGLRYRWATGERRPKLPWQGEVIP